MTRKDIWDLTYHYAGGVGIAFSMHLLGSPGWPILWALLLIGYLRETSRSEEGLLWALLHLSLHKHLEAVAWPLGGLGAISWVNL